MTTPSDAGETPANEEEFLIVFAWELRTYLSSLCTYPVQFRCGIGSKTETKTIGKAVCSLERPRKGTIWPPVFFLLLLFYFRLFCGTREKGGKFICGPWKTPFFPSSPSSSPSVEWKLMQPSGPSSSCHTWILLLLPMAIGCVYKKERKLRKNCCNCIASRRKEEGGNRGVQMVFRSDVRREKLIMLWRKEKNAYRYFPPKMF